MLQFKPIFLVSLLLVAVLVFLSGCSQFKDLKPGTVKQVSELPKAAVVDREVVMIPNATLGPVIPKPYCIGSYDILTINMNGVSDLSVGGDDSGKSSVGRGKKAAGATVDASGVIYLPQIGALKVAGLTVSQAQDAVRVAYLKYYKNPWVVIDIVEHRSKPIYLLGQFKNPGVYYMDRPMTVIEGIALGSGFDSTADLSGARITRRNGVVPIDLNSILSKGLLDSGRQHWLEAGDTIYIPDTRNQQVFVFGSVKKPGPVPIPPSGINLSQAIASAELADLGYDFKHVRIIRSVSATQGELLVVDFERILRGDALPITLKAGDVVYVPRSNVGDWNTAIAEMLPSLQAISTLLQPFVNIKYLTNN